MRMVKGLANADTDAIIAVRRDQPFTSVDDLWQRVAVLVALLVQLAEADTCVTESCTARGLVGDQGAAR